MLKRRPEAQRPRCWPRPSDAGSRSRTSAGSCTRPGEIGALLRREGLYASALTAWRAARERGAIAGLASKPRGPRVRRGDHKDRTIAAQERELAQWKARAQRAEALVEIQKIFSELVGVPCTHAGGKR